MSETVRKLLEKIDKWDALWSHHVYLPISREEAQEIRLALAPYTVRDVNARGAS